MLEFDYTYVLDSSVGAHGISQSAFENAATSTHLGVDGVDGVEEENLGELIVISQYMIAFAEEFYDINAFDQPGVKYGNKLTFAMVGRPGLEKFNTTIEASQGREPAIVR